MDSGGRGEVVTLAHLRERREEILRIAAARGARNVRVVGLVHRGEAGVARLARGRPRDRTRSPVRPPFFREVIARCEV